MDELKDDVTAEEIKQYCLREYDAVRGNKGYGYRQGLNTNYHQQYKKTIQCRDCDIYEKCEDAGKIKIIDNYPYQVMFNGILIYEGCYHSNWMTNIIKVLKGHHEPQDECVFIDIVRKYVPDNSVMIELGSFWGFYSLILKKEKPLSKNYLVEPVLDKLKIGKHNFDINNFSGTFINSHISKERSNTFKDWDDKNIYCQGITLDDLIKYYDLDRVNIVHADIQGAELELLDECESLKNEKIDFLFIGTHVRNNIIKEKLLKYNYHILVDIEKKETYADDGLVVACCSKFKNIIIPNISKYNNFKGNLKFLTYK